MRREPNPVLHGDEPRRLHRRPGQLAGLALHARSTTDGPLNYADFIAGVGALAMGSTTYEWILDHEFAGKDPAEWTWPYDIPVLGLHPPAAAGRPRRAGRVHERATSQPCTARGRSGRRAQRLDRRRRRPGRPVRRRRAARRGDRRSPRSRSARARRSSPPDRPAPRGAGTKTAISSPRGSRSYARPADAQGSAVSAGADPRRSRSRRARGSRRAAPPAMKARPPAR